MSTRLYPVYQRGNPQLRIFLPNFWLKLVRPSIAQPSNVVTFHCHMKMTSLDVKNYIERIYKVPTMLVRTRIKMGKIKKNNTMQCVTKDDDIKIAYVTLPNDQHFEFPSLKNENEEEKIKKHEDDTFQEIKDMHKQFLKTNNKPGVPGWYSI